ncbi:MAG: alpha-amylase/4-alpha-glucanotransferase domain-containing protein [Spirochaetota bacterium]
MRKLKLVLGTYNSPPVGTSQEQFEKTYQYSYKPFLTILYKYAMLRGAFHFSGTLLEWLEEKHPEFNMVLNEMVKRKQIELLGGGYYSPIFPIIPSKDRLGQIELLTTYIRKKFSKRPRGCWITEGVWEPSITSTIKSSGMEYLFLDDVLFFQSGITEEHIYRPFITDDQGKTAIVLPLHNNYINKMFIEKPETLVQELAVLSEHAERNIIVNLLLNGDFFMVNSSHYSNFFSEGGWLERFLQALTEHNTTIETTLPGRFVRSLGPVERVYFPSHFLKNNYSNTVSGGGEQNGNEFGHVSANGNLFHLSTFISTSSRPNFFRQYITMYPEIQRLYAKMMYIHLIVGQVRGDRSRKKTAKEESWRGQTHAAFWHSHDGGIYRNSVRKAVYAGLINAEKTTREKGIFSTSVNVTDIDLDGIPEYLYQGQFINAYVHRRGAALFELDYVVTACNYLDTIARHREPYHDQQDACNGYDEYMKNSFLDHFYDEEVTVDSLANNGVKEKIDFLHSLYRARKVEKERKEVNFGIKKQVTVNGYARDVDLFKDYDFLKNSINVSYKMTTNSPVPITGRFATEINLSFPEEGRSQLSFIVTHTEGKTELENGKIELFNVTELTLHDRRNRTLITITTNKPATLWTFPVYTITEHYGKKIWIYQHTTCILSWECSIEQKQQFESEVSLRIEKK